MDFRPIRACAGPYLYFKYIYIEAEVRRVWIKFICWKTILFCANYIYNFLYIYRESASRFSHGTVLNTLKQSRKNIKRKKDATTFSRQAWWQYLYSPIIPYGNICIILAWFVACFTKWHCISGAFIDIIILSITVN